MALPTILFNNASGSNTAASGAGPGTAMTGTAAAHTNGSSSSTVTLTNSPDLSGVATDGSAAIWIDTASGRKWSKITGADNSAKTVTVQDSFNIASGAARDYAIGGKRQTLAGSTQLGSDVYEGWTVQFEDTPPNLSGAYTWAPTTASGDGPLVIMGPSATSRVVFTQTSNAATFSLGTGASYLVRSLEFVNTNGTKTSANVLDSAGSSGSMFIRLENCVIGHSTNTQRAAFLRASGTVTFASLTFVDCEIRHLTVNVWTDGGTISACHVSAVGCWIHDNASHGITVSGTAAQLRLVHNLITGNGGDGINLASANATLPACAYNTVHGNAGDGLDTSNASGTGSNQNSRVVINNNFTGNGGYGWNGSASGDRLPGFHGHNNYGTGGTANTSGARNNLSAGVGDLAVDPGYANAGSANFTVGANVRGLAFPPSSRAIGAGASGTTHDGDIGVARHADPAGAGSGVSRARVLLGG